MDDTPIHKASITEILSTLPSTSPSYRLDSSPIGDDLNEVGRDYGAYQEKPPALDDRLRQSTTAAPNSVSFRRVLISPALLLLVSFRRATATNQCPQPEVDNLEREELEQVYERYLKAINIRRKYTFEPRPPKDNGDIQLAFDDLPSNNRERVPSRPQFDPVIPGPTEHCFKWIDGVVHVYGNMKEMENNKPLFAPVADLTQYYRDLNTLLGIMSDGPCKTHSYKRLRVLEARFDLHKILNEEKEKLEQKAVQHRDFYNVYKVDTHIHLSSAMNQKHLLKFIKRKLREEPNEVVIHRNGKDLTLQQVFESLNLQAHELSVDSLDVHADTRTFHRFDRFNLKYNPVGESRLREIFLKTDNMIKGRYMAEIVTELIATLEASKYQCAEWRVSIYGRSKQEWDKLAAWVVDNNLISNQVRWLVQVPRLFHVYKESGQMNNFQEMITNIFEPLFEVTKDPSSHPKLHQFLQYCVGFDSVDDESKPEPRILRKYPSPSEWSFDKNPPYTILYVKNQALLRCSYFNWRPQTATLMYRPHSGEAGDIDHLASAFMVSNGIAHGIMLRKTPVLQYLFYLTQIGLYMSPLSNNSLFLDYSRNPFPTFFGRGLNVSLSTDDPLQFHYTKEPIIEEYSIAAQVWKFTTADICEIAANSVRQSGFGPELKRQWLGPNFHLPGVKGNDITKSNVPMVRALYRHETLMEELGIMFSVLENKEDLDLTWLVDQLVHSHDKAIRAAALEWHRTRVLAGSKEGAPAPSAPVDVPTKSL